MNFSCNEMVDMIFILGEADRNSLLAVRLYKEKYPERRTPQVLSFEKLKERFERTGCVNYNKCNRKKRTCSLENEQLVMETVVESPQISVRQLERNLDITKSSIGRIIKKNKFYPYHMYTTFARIIAK